MLNHTKILLLFVFIALLNSVLCKNHLCPKIEPVKNFNLTKFAGDWYLLAASDTLTPSVDKCHRSYYNLINDTLLELRQNWFTSSGSPLRNVVNLKLDTNRPGVFSMDDEVTINGLIQVHKKEIQTELVVVDTDYENYQLVYSCTDVHHFWRHEKRAFFYIAIRSRYFDSFRTMVHLFESLKSLDADLNRISSVDNTIECANRK